MAWALVSGAHNITGMGPSGGTSAAMNAAAATFFLGAAGCYRGLNNTFDATALSDSSVNVWNSGSFQDDNVTTERASLFYASLPVIAGGSQTFTLGGAHAANTFPTLAMSGWTGNATSSPLDDSIGSSLDVAGTSLQVGTVPWQPTEDNCLVSAVISFASPISGLGIDSGFTILDFFNNDGTSTGCAIAYSIQMTSTIVNPTWTWTGASIAATRQASWKAAAASAARQFNLVRP